MTTLEFKAARYNNSALPLIVKTTSLPVTVENGEYKLPTNTSVLVKVHAAALNPLDIVIKNSLSPWLFRAERGLGGDFAGEVVAIGDVAAKKLDAVVGDRINGLHLENLLLGPGSVSEYVLIDVIKSTGQNARKIPSSLSYQQAAAYPLVLGTAITMFSEVLPSNSFKKILILGAGTSVGRFCVQLAKKVYNAEDIVVTCSGRSETLIKQLGANKVIDYSRHTSILKPVLEEVKDGVLFDVILDCCGNSDLFSNISEILKKKDQGGSYLTIVGNNKMVFSKSVVMGLVKNATSQLRKLGSSLGFLSYKYNMTVFTGLGAWPDEGVKYIEEKGLEIFIDSEYPLEEVSKAFERVESNKAVGKVIVNIC